MPLEDKIQRLLVVAARPAASPAGNDAFRRAAKEEGLRIYSMKAMQRAGLATR